MKQPTRVCVFGADVLPPHDRRCVAYYDECPSCEVGALVVVRGASGFAQPCDIGYRCTFCGLEADYYPPAFGKRHEGEDAPPVDDWMATVKYDTRSDAKVSLRDFWSNAIDRAIFASLLTMGLSHWLGIKAVVERPKGMRVVIFDDSSKMYRHGDEVVSVWHYKDERR